MEILPWAALATVAMLSALTALMAHRPESPERGARRVLLNRLIRQDLDP